MKTKYIRFVVDNGQRKLLGLFQESVDLIEDETDLTAKDKSFLEDTFQYFNDWLPCPPWSKNDWERGVSYFKTNDDANEFIQRMHDLSKILKKYGRTVKMIQTNTPGKILYEDDYQVVAIPWKGE